MNGAVVIVITGRLVRTNGPPNLPLCDAEACHWHESCYTLRGLRGVLAGAATNEETVIMCSKQCPCCRFVASATSLTLAYEALFHHFEAMHPKDPA